MNHMNCMNCMNFMNFMNYTGRCTSTLLAGPRYRADGQFIAENPHI